LKEGPPRAKSRRRLTATYFLPLTPSQARTLPFYYFERKHFYFSLLLCSLPPPVRCICDPDRSKPSILGALGSPLKPGGDVAYSQTARPLLPSGHSLLGQRQQPNKAKQSKSNQLLLHLAAIAPEKTTQHSTASSFVRICYSLCTEFLLFPGCHDLVRLSFHYIPRDSVARNKDKSGSA
jgi:hypothetical protein